MSKCILIARHPWPDCSPDEVIEVFGEFASPYEAEAFVTNWQLHEKPKHRTLWLLTTLTNPLQLGEIKRVPSKKRS